MAGKGRGACEKANISARWLEHVWNNRRQKHVTRAIADAVKEAVLPGMFAATGYQYKVVSRYVELVIEAGVMLGLAKTPEQFLQQFEQFLDSEPVLNQ